MRDTQRRTRRVAPSLSVGICGANGGWSGNEPVLSFSSHRQSGRLRCRPSEVGRGRWGREAVTERFAGSGTIFGELSYFPRLYCGSFGVARHWRISAIYLRNRVWRGRGTHDSVRMKQDPVGVRRSYLSEAAAPMEIGAATSQLCPSPLAVIWEGRGAGRLISTEAREPGKPTGTSSGTPGVATVAGGCQGIRERTLSDQPGAMAPDGEGNVWPSPSEFERAYVFGRHLAMTFSSAFFEARTLKSRPRRQ